MTLMYFDTLKCVKLLTEAGFNSEQAEAINEAQMTNIQILLSQVATKTEMHTEFQKVRSEIKDVEHRLRSFVLTSTITIIVSMFTVIGLGLASLPYIL